MYRIPGPAFERRVARACAISGLAAKRVLMRRGNHTMGLRDQLVFPEIDYTRVGQIKGMNITLTTTAKNDEEGRELLNCCGVPLRPQAEAGTALLRTRPNRLRDYFEAERPASGVWSLARQDFEETHGAKTLNSPRCARS